MFKFVTILVLATTSFTLAAPKPGVLAAAPLLHAPAVVTAQSSQVIARNYNALAAPLVAAPVVAPAPVVAAPLVRASPFVAPAHVVAAPAPYVAAAPYIGASPYVASPYAAPYVL